MDHPSFGRRFLAWLIDNVVIGTAAVVVLFASGGAAEFMAEVDGSAPNPFAFAPSFPLILMVLALQFVYYGAMWSRDGQSLGKRAMGVEVVGRDGGLLSFASAGLRGTFGYWVSGTVFYLGYLWALFDANDETWHDKLFNSEVVRV